MRPLTALLAASFVAVSSMSVFSQETPTIDKILERGQIVIGHRNASPPFGFVADDGSVTGYTVEICKYAAEYLKSKLEKPNLVVAYVPADPSNRIPLIQNGTIDLECAGTGNTFARQDVVQFSYNTFYSETLIAVRKSGGIKSVVDLEGKRVAVPQGTLQVEMLNALATERGLNITPVMGKDATEVFLLLETGRADAAINDPLILSSAFSKSSTPDDFAFLTDWSAPPGASGIMMALGDERFRGIINEGIKDMIATGKFQENYDKWFGGPPYHLPMSQLLKDQMANPNDTALD